MNAENHYRRRRRFVDKVIQGQLLLALIIIESLLFTIGMVVIYNDLQGVIQDNIYRVHQEVASGRPILMKELLMIFPWIISINLLILVYVDRRWKKIVRGILRHLQDILHRVKRLDLRVYPVQQNEHEVLQKAKGWLDKERDRYSSLIARMNELPDTIDMNDHDAVYHARERLKSMSRLLPDA